MIFSFSNIYFKTRNLLIISILFYSISFAQNNPKKQKTPVGLVYSGNSGNSFLDSLTSVEIDGHWVDILTPSGIIKGDILVLPGWNFPRQDWCNKSSLCRKAISQGYRLIMPEMGKSVYSSQFYPETFKEWQRYPHKKWVIEQLIPTLQKEYKILSINNNNYILGLSTGGRGAALIALALPNLFKACAALSGDFDQTQMPHDKLMIAYYGTYKQFPARWEGEDNPLRQVAKLETPIYLGHGLQDAIVPVKQTESFYKALIKAQPKLKVKINLIKAGHDYQYWNSEIENVLSFFTDLK